MLVGRTLSILCCRLRSGVKKVEEVIQSVVLGKDGPDILIWMPYRTDFFC